MNQVGTASRSIHNIMGVKGCSCKTLLYKAEQCTRVKFSSKTL